MKLGQRIDPATEVAGLMRVGRHLPPSFAHSFSSSSYSLTHTYGEVIEHVFVTGTRAYSFVLGKGRSRGHCHRQEAGGSPSLGAVDWPVVPDERSVKSACLARPAL